MFHDYLKQYDAKNARKALIELFKVLDQKPEDRDDYLDDDFAAFPYVNGGLFKDKDIETPNFSDEIINLLLTKASENFDWSLISPTIFSAVFESTLNSETRRSGGIHYTSIENIHKVINPLFLDNLRAEFYIIKESKQANVRKAKLEEFQNKLASLKFLEIKTRYLIQKICSIGTGVSECCLECRYCRKTGCFYIQEDCRAHNNEKGTRRL